MSSTNRGGKRSEADAYDSPSWTVHRLLEKLPLPGGRWLDPCAGHGAIISAVNELRSDILWDAVELREECRRDLELLTPNCTIQDFFETELQSSYDVIITNPPYRLAEQFVRKCMQHSDIVVMLLRVNFLGSAKRVGFMQEHAPDIFVLPNRPSFVGNGKTDSPEYGWFAWHGTHSRKEGAISVLDTTPLEERKSAHQRLLDLYEQRRATLLSPSCSPSPTIAVSS